VIVLTKRDVTRLAKHLKIDFDDAEQRYTRKDHGYKRIMKRQPDGHYGRICHFFDVDERRCTIYRGRPAICRDFPGTRKCGYYDFLKFERTGQEDDEYVSTTWHDED
jgi:Fe-S-cluster containining protein